VYVLAGVPDCGGGGVFALQESMDRISAISRVVAMAIRGLTCLLAGAGWLGGEGWLGRRDWLRWECKERGGDRYR